MKKCSKCKVDKPLELFYKDAQKSDGLRSCCVPCHKEDVSNKMKDGTYGSRIRASAMRSYRKRMKNQHEHHRSTENAYRKERYDSDPEYRRKIILRSSEAKTKRRKENPRFRAISNASRRIGNFLRYRTNKYSHTLGCNLETVKGHIEAKFEPGMSWDNYGEWHIDHIFPVSIAYDLGPDSFAKACHFTNLQPLWAKDNLEKSNKIK